jgi:hypothetical protein
MCSSPLKMGEILLLSVDTVTLNSVFANTFDLPSWTSSRGSVHPVSHCSGGGFSRNWW